jgi:hypothetical protein
MRESFWKQTLPFALLIALALLSAGAAVAQPPGPPGRPEIPEGSDCWQTQKGTEQRLAAFPAGFFGTGSAAIPPRTIQFQGVPLDPAFVAAAYPKGCGCPEHVTTTITWLDPHNNPTRDMRHAVKQVIDRKTDIDTCIHRKTNAKFQGQGKAVKVDIELVALSLKSVSPLTVSYRGGTTKAFDVFIKQSSPPQQTGTMTFTPAPGNKKGDVKLGQLHIKYDAKFVGPGGSPTFTRTDKLTLAGTNGKFEIVP